MKIAICFFGITRSLKYTIGNIEKNIIKPASELAEVKLFGHFFNQKHVVNSRSGENEKLKSDEFKLLKLDEVILEEPDEFLPNTTFEASKTYGDNYDDDFTSLRNLYHQLYSLKRVTLLAEKWHADIVIFVRPDLMYHDSFYTDIKRALTLKDGVLLPNWQHWNGYNDRFAIVSGENAIASYGKRFHKTLEFSIQSNASLNSEALLEFALKENKVGNFKLRASRVRANGEMKSECFYHQNLLSFQNRIANLLNISFDNFVLMTFTKIMQRVLFGKSEL
ncbi:hypothetical protein J3L16_05800 [Alteromonas sp. 5E99-2]|uniref:hypothetical protein n=1 Tax=Alteromonas sp. 5E99-2 TaxID=2817683 RepID=UPI001A99C3C0|nr:hypothetical protein [Alteromonas sp. 5E99-2]MBO1255197.1 hypothetical protein [Alteromonas sp. 5E99-2]